MCNLSLGGAESGSLENWAFIALDRTSITASDMIQKGRMRGEQFEPAAAADQQINWWALIPTDAKTAAFARIEHTEHTNI